MKSRFGLFVIALLSLSCLLTAQAPLPKKDWTQWSKDECKRVQEDSPWAYKYTISKVQDMGMGSGNISTRGNNGGSSAETRIDVSYVIQLRSARPIREAVVRDMLIQNNYDKLDDKQKGDLLKQVQPFIDKSYDDVIVIHVIYGSNIPEYNNILRTYWQSTFPPGTVPQEAYLNTPSAKKIPAAKFVAPRGASQEFELIFPRTVDGKPVLAEGDKSISVEFRSPAINPSSTVTTGNVSLSAGGAREERVLAEFKVDKMVRDAKLLY